MSVIYIAAGDEIPYQRIKLSSLLISITDPLQPTKAIRNIEHLCTLLLLSNYPKYATTLYITLQQHRKTIVPRFRYYSDHPVFYPDYLQNCWVEYPELRPNSAPIPELAAAQWGKYREANRTGWMKEHCNLPEPEDPHCWRESDDPAMLAMCARLLSKNTTQGQYPSLDHLREALEASLKLYSRDEMNIVEWLEDRKDKPVVTKWERKWRHSYLLYRRLVVDIAIRIDELETAVKVMSDGLKIDGSINGAHIYDYLFVPGIWKVLPLFAKGRKDLNPFYIEEKDADIIVKEVCNALVSRAKNGRDWLLAPEKVGIKELLERLKDGAWKVNRNEYKKNLGLSCADDILFPPASESEIEVAEAIVGELPPDFKEMVRIANG